MTAALEPRVIAEVSPRSKLLRTAGAFLLTGAVWDGLCTFVQRLNDRGILGLGSQFGSTSPLWGEGVGLNLLHLVVLVIATGTFGALAGYMCRRLSLSERILSSAVCAFLLLWATPLLLTVLIFRDASARPGLRLAMHMVAAEPLWVGFLGLKLVIPFAVALYTSGLALKAAADPRRVVDTRRSGTLFDIKWYHYTWGSLCVKAYVTIAAFVLYLTGHTLVTFVRSVGWLEFLGITTAERSSFDVAWGSFFVLWIVCLILGSALNYMRMLLNGDLAKHWAYKALVCIVVGFAVPGLIMYYTGMI